MAYIKKTTVFCIVLLAGYTVSQVEAVDDCQSHYECPGLKYCCKRKTYQYSICLYNCVGQSCSVDSNCAPGESCCGGTCRSGYDCIGQSCTFDSDCGSGECCDNDDTCSLICDLGGLAGWIIAVIVISVIAGIVLPIAVVVFCCCCAAAASRRPAYGGVVVTQPTGNTVIVNQQQQQQLYPVQQGQPMYTQNPQSYPNQPPPAYPNQLEQEYPGQPPQYKPDQVTAPLIPVEVKTQ